MLNAGSATLKGALLAASGERLWQDIQSWNPQDPANLDAVVRPWLLAAISPWALDLQLVAHRIVHGGPSFSGPIRLDGANLAALEALTPLAPLHNGPALALVRAVQAWLPATKDHWACFDTAFHHSLPEAARTYALPASWRQQGLRRFGFHGLNHQHVSEVVQRQLGGDDSRLRLVSCHLGAGCSLCAIEAGRSIATTMGFTPLEGLVMATRCGSIDPGLILHQWRQGLALQQVEHSLQAESGLLGLSGLSGDMRVLREAAAGGHAGAVLALAVFRHQLIQGIGAMVASLGGVDVIALSGGIGEHDQALRAELQAALRWLEPCRWLVVPADEEGQIARSCVAATGLGARG